MADLNLSLDDLIKKNKKTHTATASRGRGRGRGATAAAGRGRGATIATAYRGRGRGAGRGTVGGVARAVRSGTARAPFKPQGGNGSTGFGTKRTTTTPEGRWQHDKYEDVGDLRQNMGAAKAKAAAKGVVVPKGGLTTGTKITVTNLETAVTQQDMKDLFETIGPLKSTKMTAVGVAEIVFKQAKDATTAFQKYNNVVLDGRPMCITVAKPAIQAAAATQRLGRATGAVATSAPTRGRGALQPTFHVTV